jgi:hypothetical protein
VRRWWCWARPVWATRASSTTWKSKRPRRFYAASP